MAALATHVASFAQLITKPGGDLQAWIDAVTADDLPALHTFVTGLDKDRPTVQAGLRLPYSNGPTEGVNTKTKLLKRQTYGRAGFALLRHRILLS
jgi:transposase